MQTRRPGRTALRLSAPGYFPRFSLMVGAPVNEPGYRAREGGVVHALPLTVWSGLTSGNGGFT